MRKQTTISVKIDATAHVAAEILERETKTALFDQKVNEMLQHYESIGGLVQMTTHQSSNMFGTILTAIFVQMIND